MSASPSPRSPLAIAGPFTSTRDPAGRSEARFRFAGELSLSEEVFVDRLHVQTTLRGAAGQVLYCDDDSLDLDFRVAGTALVPVGWRVSVPEVLVSAATAFELRFRARLLALDARSALGIDQLIDLSPGGAARPPRPGDSFQVGPARVTLLRHARDSSNDVKIEVVGEADLSGSLHIDRFEAAIHLYDEAGGIVGYEERNIDVWGGRRGSVFLQAQAYFSKPLVDATRRVEVALRSFEFAHEGPVHLGLDEVIQLNDD